MTYCLLFSQENNLIVLYSIQRNTEEVSSDLTV